jgi:hypothetical protein
MELVASLFTAAAASAPAAGAAAGAAGAAGSLASVAAGTSGALSILQGAASAGSALFSLASGFSGAKAEDLAAKAEANRIKREELIKIGQLRVAFAGSGIDIGGGQALSLEEDLQSQADYEIGTARATGKMRSTNALLKASGQAFGTVTNSLIDIARRG